MKALKTLMTGAILCALSLTAFGQATISTTGTNTAGLITQVIDPVTAANIGPIYLRSVTVGNSSGSANPVRILDAPGVLQYYTNSAAFTNYAISVISRTNTYTDTFGNTRTNIILVQTNVPTAFALGFRTNLYNVVLAQTVAASTSISQDFDPPLPINFGLGFTNLANASVTITYFK